MFLQGFLFHFIFKKPSCYVVYVLYMLHQLLDVSFHFANLMVCLLENTAQ